MAKCKPEPREDKWWFFNFIAGHNGKVLEKLALDIASAINKRSIPVCQQIYESRNPWRNWVESDSNTVKTYRFILQSRVNYCMLSTPFHYRPTEKRLNMIDLRVFHATPVPPSKAFHYYERIARN